MSAASVSARLAGWEITAEETTRSLGHGDRAITLHDVVVRALRPG